MSLDHRPPRQIDLELVAPGFGIVGRRMAILPVEHGIDVPAAISSRPSISSSTLRGLSLTSSTRGRPPACSIEER